TARYHKLMWKHLHNLGIAHLLQAKYQGETLVSWIAFVWHDTLYYPYGASSINHKNVMAPNLMMWEAIKFGKSRELKLFDLWGKEEGKGFTRFKEGYNPKVVEFVGTWDLIVSPTLYKIYRTAENLRWKFLKIPLPLPKPSFR
ncbi:MAG: peptidoglycan bridge formation glycyltransferase FemA/FemB family protein, partial [Candidatus Blackburnbacteria bacterium]|nr:peptidoglycan bridge formation glycyltransferase FemA/FemB family protein [Candidatus Blackburnbacteria bacterium]